MTEREAYQKSLDRWKEILRVISGLYFNGLKECGSSALSIPSCSMCVFYKDKGRCRECSWFDNCGKEESFWREINTSACDLHRLIGEYLKRAQKHFDERDQKKEKEKEKEPKFKVRDIVKMKIDSHPLAGKTGKVLCINESGLSAGVQFVEPFPEGHTCNGNGRRGYCWWVAPYHLDLIYREKE